MDIVINGIQSEYIVPISNATSAYKEQLIKIAEKMKELEKSTAGFKKKYASGGLVPKNYSSVTHEGVYGYDWPSPYYNPKKYHYTNTTNPGSVWQEVGYTNHGYRNVWSEDFEEDVEYIPGENCVF